MQRLSIRFVNLSIYHVNFITNKTDNAESQPKAFRLAKLISVLFSFVKHCVTWKCAINFFLHLSVQL